MHWSLQKDLAPEFTYRKDADRFFNVDLRSLVVNGLHTSGNSLQKWTGTKDSLGQTNTAKRPTLHYNLGDELAHLRFTPANNTSHKVLTTSTLGGASVHDGEYSVVCVLKYHPDQWDSSKTKTIYNLMGAPYGFDANGGWNAFICGLAGSLSSGIPNMLVYSQDLHNSFNISVDASGIYAPFETNYTKVILITWNRGGKGIIACNGKVYTRAQVSGVRTNSSQLCVGDLNFNNPIAPFRGDIYHISVMPYALEYDAALAWMYNYMAYFLSDTEVNLLNDSDKFAIQSGRTYIQS